MRPTKTNFPFFLIFLFTGCLISAKAQRVINQIPISFPVSFNMNASASVFTNVAKDTACIFLTTEEDAIGYIINKEQKLIQQFTFQKETLRDKVISAFFINGTIVFLTSHNDHVTEYVYRFSDHSVQSMELRQPKTEVPMALITADSSFYILSCVKKSSALVLRMIAGFGEMHVDSFHIITNNDRNFFKPTFYETITTNREQEEALNFGYASSVSPDAEILNKDCKIYYQDDSIYMVMNGFLKDALVISFSPKKPEPTYRKIVTTMLPDCNTGSVNIRFNSYLLNSKLYTVSACEKILQTEATDVNTGAQKLIQITHSDSGIAYANTPILLSMTDKQSGPHYNRELDTKQLLRKMMDGNVVIKAEETNYDIKLTVGSYKEIKLRHGSLLPLDFNWILTATDFVLSTMVFHPTNEKITRFISVWDKNTFNHRQGLSEVPLEQKIDRCKIKLEIRTYKNCEAVYRINDSDMYVYYEPESRALKIVSL